MAKKLLVVWCGGSRSVGSSMQKAVKLARTKSSPQHARGGCNGANVLSEWPSHDGRFHGQTLVICRNKVCKRVPGALESGRERLAGARRRG